MNSLDSNTLIQPFTTLAKLPNVKYQPYYTGVFDEYEYYLIKNEKVDLEWLSGANLRTPILEVGSGEGRVLSFLSELDIECYGIEMSTEAIERFNSRYTSDKPYPSIFNGDFLSYEFKKKFGSVIIPNLTINLFSDIASLNALIKKIISILRRPGQFALSIFSDASIEKMGDSYRGQTFVVPYLDNAGIDRIMWTGLKFDKEKRIMIQNWYTQIDPANGYIAADTQKFWLSDELTDILSSWGFELTAKFDGSINGGGANGFKIDHLIFSLNV